MKGARLVLIVVLVIVGVVRYFLVKPDYKEGQILEIRGKILSEPKVYNYSQKIKVKNVNIYLPRYPEYFYQDEISVRGEYRKNALYYPEVLSQKSSSGIFISLRKNIIGFIKRVLPEPHASLVGGITIGSKGSLSEQFASNLRKTGTMHVVVASGMNVSFVAGFLLSFLIYFLPRYKAVLVCLVGVWGYITLCGLEAPLIRAGVMISTALIAQAKGKITDGVFGLFLSFFVMLAINPLWILDLGFILSFLATSGIILFEAKVRKLFSFLPRIICEGVSTTISAQVFIIPILFVTYGNFSFWSFIVNPLILWVVPLIILICTVSFMLYLVIPFLGTLILYTLYPLTWWFIHIVEIFS